MTTWGLVVVLVVGCRQKVLAWRDTLLLFTHARLYFMFHVSSFCRWTEQRVRGSLCAPVVEDALLVVQGSRGLYTSTMLRLNSYTDFEGLFWNSGALRTQHRTVSRRQARSNGKLLELSRTTYVKHERTNKSKAQRPHTHSSSPRPYTADDDLRHLENSLFTLVFVELSTGAIDVVKRRIVIRGWRCIKRTSLVCRIARLTAVIENLASRRWVVVETGELASWSLETSDATVVSRGYRSNDVRSLIRVIVVIVGDVASGLDLRTKDVLRTTCCIVCRGRGGDRHCVCGCGREGSCRRDCSSRRNNC